MAKGVPNLKANKRRKKKPTKTYEVKIWFGIGLQFRYSRNGLERDEIQSWIWNILLVIVKKNKRFSLLRY